MIRAAIRYVAVGIALGLVPAFQPLSASVMAQEAADSLNLNGKWQFGDAVVQVTHGGSAVRADFIEGGPCFDGQVRPFFLEGELSGTSLTGRMMVCSGSPRLVQECPLSSMYETTFEATVEANQIAGTRVAQGIATEEEGGRFTSCRPDSQYDESRPFDGTRLCDDAEREVEELRADMDAQTEALNELAEQISSTPGVGNWPEEGYAGPAADLAAQWHAMEHELLHDLLPQVREAEARLAECQGRDEQCPSPDELEDLRARLEAVVAESNAIADQLGAMPPLGNWFEEGYLGPNADLAARWREVEQEMLQLVEQLNATQDPDEAATLQAQVDALGAEANSLEDVLNNMNATDWTREDYIGPNAELAARWRALDAEGVDVVHQLQELEQRQRECAEAVG